MRYSKCPCCGFDFEIKDYDVESKKLLSRYDDKTRDFLMSVIKSISKIELITKESLYQFLQGISKIDVVLVKEGVKSFYTGGHVEKGHGLQYLKKIILNMRRYRQQMETSINKSLGAKSKELPDD